MRKIEDADSGEWFYWQVKLYVLAVVVTESESNRAHEGFESSFDGGDVGPIG